MMRSILRLVGAALIAGFVGPIAGSTIALWGRFLAHGTAMGSMLFGLVWFGSSALGGVLFGPLFLTLGAQRPPWHRRRLLETGLLGLSLVAVSVGAFFTPMHSALAELIGFAAFPPLMWAASRFGTTGTARAAVCLSVLTLWPVLTSFAQLELWRDRWRD